MRCQACNDALTEFESTNKNSEGEFEDLCNTCLKKSGVYQDDVEEEVYINGVKL